MKNDHMSDEMSRTVFDAITILETAFQSSSTVLSPDAKKKYGSVSKNNKLIANKTMKLKIDFPSKTCPDVDWEKFDADYKSRIQMEEMLLRIDQIRALIYESKIRYDYDNFQAARLDFRYSKYKNNMNVPGYVVKVQEYKHLFTFSKKRSKKVDDGSD